MIEALSVLIDDLERAPSLLEPEQLRQRMDALDRLESHLAWAPSEHRDRIRRLCDGLEEANQRLYQSIRRDIQRGRGAERLLEWARAVGTDPSAEPKIDGDSYDHVDTLLSGVLQMEEPASEIAEPDAEMVFYQPTPARHILELIKRTELQERDVLIDLGSGLGHVPLLAAISTGARCIGIEWEAAYVACARRCAVALNLSNVTFVQQDARATDLSAGTVFYLYTPFKGAMLSDMLAMLRREADTREIRICTLGPCTLAVAQESWLEGACTGTDKPALFRSLRK